MMLTEQKEKLISDINVKAMDAFNNHFYFNPMNQTFNDFKASVGNAVGYAIATAVRELIDKTYTNQDFEKDIGLR